MFQKMSHRRVFSGKVLDVNQEEHRMPDGRESTFEIIRHPGGAAILPELPDGRLLLIKQFRPSIGRMIYEIPAGRLDPGESAHQCAARELVEETGYAAGDIVALGSFWSTVGFCDEKIDLYLGRALTLTVQQLEADEYIELCPMTVDCAMHKLDAGEIFDSKTQIALMQYHRLIVRPG